MDLISVIVPIYKAERFLDRCVSSIINQTYRNLEIILVDDGSPDRCPEICDEWAKRDERIRVIHKMNGGGGQARNVALATAKGDLIAFVDSDDYISLQMYEYMVSLFKPEIDIVECGFITTYGNNTEFDGTDSEINVSNYSGIEAMRENIKDNIFRQLIWNKLYRKSAIDGINFPEGKQIDDEFWTYKVLGNARNLIYSTRRLYAYRQQENSVMHMKYSLKRLQGIEAKCERHDYIVSKYPELVAESRCNIWLSCLYHGQLALRTLPKAEQVEAFRFLVKVAESCPLLNEDMIILSFTHRMWLRLAKVSLRFSCGLRNFFGIGL